MKLAWRALMNVVITATAAVLCSACGSNEASTKAKALGESCSGSDECASQYCNDQHVCGSTGGLYEFCMPQDNCNPGLECANGRCHKQCQNDADCTPDVCSTEPPPGPNYCAIRCKPEDTTGGWVCADGHMLSCSDAPSNFCPNCGCQRLGYDCAGDHCQFGKPQQPTDTRLFPVEVGREWTYTSNSSIAVGGSSEGKWSLKWLGSDGYVTIGQDPDNVALYTAAFQENLVSTPVVAGASWDAGFKDGTKFTWSDEGSVSVPAGAFDLCWRKTASYNKDVYEIFCRGVGLVAYKIQGTYGELKTANFLAGQDTY